MKTQYHYAGLPGFASGVVNWQGGLARVNERGGEIQYLERGTTVIPNDISLQIAKSVGEAVGRAVGNIATPGIDYNRLAAAMEGMTVKVNDREFGRIVRDYVQ